MKTAKCSTSQDTVVCAEAKQEARTAVCPSPLLRPQEDEGRHSINGAIIPCLLEQVLEQQPLKSLKLFLEEVEHCVTPILWKFASAWMAWVKSTINSAPKSLNVETMKTVLQQGVPSSAWHCICLYWTTPPGDHPLNNQLQQPSLFLLPCSCSCQDLKCPCWDKKGIYFRWHFHPLATVYSSLLTRDYI